MYIPNNQGEGFVRYPIYIFFKTVQEGKVFDLKYYLGLKNRTCFAKNFEEHIAQHLRNSNFYLLSLSKAINFGTRKDTILPIFD